MSNSQDEKEAHTTDDEEVTGGSPFKGCLFAVVVTLLGVMQEVSTGQ